MAGRIALTFDDGPDPVWTPRVLDALANADARATFFVVAPLAERYPALLRRAVEEGHEVAHVPTPEADVAVPPLPNQQEPGSGAGSGEQGGRVSSTDSKRNALIALGVVVGFIFVLIVAAATAGGQGVGVVLMLSILPALALLLRTGGGGSEGKDETGRLVLRVGSDNPSPNPSVRVCWRWR